MAFLIPQVMASNNIIVKRSLKFRLDMAVNLHHCILKGKELLFQYMYLCHAGVAVALGTDFNPNAFCLSMVSKYECMNGNPRK